MLNQREQTPDLPTGDPDSLDRALLSQVAAADRTSFDDLYRRYYPRLVNFAMRSTSRADLAEEVAADTLFTVWQKAKSFRGGSKVSTWIFGIAYRKSLKALSKSLRRESRTGGDVEQTAEPAEAPNQNAVIFKDQVAAALRELPVEQRTVVILTFVYGYKYEEIAAIVGRPVNTIKTRMRAARLKLHAVYGESPVGGE